MKPRDQQRARVYRAERAWRQRIDRGPVLDLVECYSLARFMLNWGDGDEFRFELVEVDIRDGRGRRSAAANFTGYEAELSFPIHARYRDVVCHEVAHILTWRDAGGAHGPAFCRAYIRLVREFMGPHEAAALVEELLRAKVRITE